jgi:hypothetical protein
MPRQCHRIEAGDSCPNRATQRLGLVWTHDQGTSVSYLDVLVCDGHPDIDMGHFVTGDTVGMVRARLKQHGLHLLGEGPTKLIRQAL